MTNTDSSLRWFRDKSLGSNGHSYKIHLLNENGIALCGWPQRKYSEVPKWTEWKSKNPNKKCKVCSKRIE